MPVKAGLGFGLGSVPESAFRNLPSAFKWSPRLVSRQRLLGFSEALICLSYSGRAKFAFRKWNDAFDNRIGSGRLKGVFNYRRYN